MPPRRAVSNLRCTIAQKKALVDYMSTHIRLARYECDAATRDIEWQQLAETLNRSGTVKTVDTWQATWGDLRRKAAREQAEARTTNCSISEISQKIREIMTDSNEGVPSNICLSPAQSISIHSLEESDQDQDLETDMTLAQESLVQTMEVPAEYMAQARPESELESLQGAPVSSTDSSPCNSPTPMNKTRCTRDQINALVDCMAINTSIAFGRQNTEKKAGDWKRLRQFLNSMGPAKRTVAWQKTWRDLKRSAVVSSKTKSAWKKPTTKKILEIIEAHTERLKDNPNEFSADDTDLSLPPDGTSVHRAPSSPPLCEYLILPNEDGSTIRETGKHNNVSPARQSSRKMSPVHETVSFIQYDNDDDSDADSERFKARKKKMRCTNAQKVAIVDFMAQHPALATARSQTDGNTWRAEWRQLSKQLNKIGTAKTTASWKRTWRELKKNARCNRGTNHKWAEINQKIRDLIEDTSNVERPDKSAVETAEDNEPCPTDDMPLIALRRQSSHTDLHTPEVILYEEHQSNDITESNQDRNGQSIQSMEVSPERRSSMSPQQHSEEDSPEESKKEGSLESSQKSKNARCTPSQINSLLNYMSKHPSLAKAKCLYMPKGRDPWYSEWRRLTLYLNSLNKMGPAKSTTGWKVTWRSLCLNARRKKSKQCPSYEKVYKRVLKILHQETDGGAPPVTKLETIEDHDSHPTQSQSPEHRIILPDPLKCEQAPKYTSNKVLYSTEQMSPGRQNSVRHIKRGSRMSPVRISDQVSPVQRSSDRMSPGCSSEVALHRVNRRNEAHPSVAKLESAIKPSKGRSGMKPKKVRCSNGQLRALADYMIAHPGLATDKYIDHREPAWLRLTKYLNDLGPARKRTEAWKRTWRDIKNGVRARGRSSESSGGALKRFRELKVLRLIGMASPDRKNGGTENHMVEEYVLPEPEVILTPRALSPHNTQYNFAEFTSNPNNERLSENERVDRNRQRDEPSIEETSVPTTNSVLQEIFLSLSRSHLLSPETRHNLSEILRLRDNKVSSTEETVSLTTDSLLQTLLQEVRRSNELNVQQNSYLREILKQLRTQQCLHASRHADRGSPEDHGNNTQELKEEDTFIQPEGASYSDDINDSDNEILVKPSSVIRPVSISSPTMSSAPQQPYKGIKVQSILQGKVKPATPKGKLVRLKDGTMVLVPENMKKEAPGHDKNGESQYLVQNDPQNDQKLEATEDSWDLKTTEMNEC